MMKCSAPEKSVCVAVGKVMADEEASDNSEEASSMSDAGADMMAKTTYCTEVCAVRDKHALINESYSTSCEETVVPP